MATDRRIRRMMILTVILGVVGGLALAGLLILLGGCSLHLHVAERHSHYGGEPPASVTAEERIMGAFGIDDDSTTDNQ